MVDPTILAGAKAAGTVLAPALKAAKSEWARRAATAGPISLTNLDREMDEAMDVLGQNADNPGFAVLDYIKGLLSGRPPIFDHPPIKVWLKDAQAREAIRSAAYGWLVDTASVPSAGPALAHLASSDDADLAAGHAAFDYVIAFIVVSLARTLTVGDKLQLGKLDEIQELIRDQREIPHHLIDGIITEEIARLRTTRFVINEDMAPQARELVDRLTVGDLKTASAKVRASAIGNCVRWLSPSTELAELDRLLSLSRALGQTEEAVLAAAFVEARRADWQAGVAEIQPIDTPARRMVALQLRSRADDGADVLSWFKAAGFGARDLDAEGRYYLLVQIVQAEAWDDAHALVEALDPGDYLECPALYGLAGLVRVASVVADDLKPLLATGGFLVDGADFPLDDTDPALEQRRQAAGLFSQAQAAAEAAGNAQASAHFSRMALWLNLRDPLTADAARAQLVGALEDAKRNLAVLPIALSFGANVDMVAIERALDRRAALDPGGDGDTAFARFAIAQHKRSSSEVLAYFNQHRTLLYKHLNTVGMTDFEVRVLVADGQSDRALEVLTEVKDQTPPELFQRLEQIISTGPGRLTVAALEAEFEQTGSVLALGRLVEGLSRQGFSDRLLMLWRRLVLELKSRDQAEQLANFLIRHERHSDLDAMLEDIDDLITGSQFLRAAKAWSEYRAGRFVESQRRLTALLAERDDSNDRRLQVGLMLAAGRWPELLAFIDAEWAARTKRDASEVLSTAHLAAQMKSPRLTDLLIAAAQKKADDPHVQLGAYSIAVEAGLDDLASAQLWLESAIQTSGEDGPMQSVSLEDLVKQAPDWNARTDDVWLKLRAGLIPMAMAAPALRRPPLELQLAQMVANRRQDDPRRRGIVPAYSGKRGRPTLTARSFGLDLTALVNLAAVNLLDAVLASSSVHIAHGTLRGLFEQRAKLSFHQPSQIKAAHALARALATRKLLPFASDLVADSRLVAEVGAELAGMLTKAAEGIGSRYVIRSAPVTKIGSFMNDPVDLTAHSDTLCSCLGLIDKLAETGKVTGDEERRARLYLEQQEKRWPTEPAISDGAELYLDDLSVSYLQTVGALDRLSAAGFSAFVSSDEIEQANALIAMEERTEEIESIIERIGHALAAAIENGTVTVAPMSARPDGPEAAMYDVMDLATRVDAIVCDDRFLNQHQAVQYPDGSTPIWTSLDVIDWLAESGALTPAQRLEHRTSLRQAGLGLFPVDAAELEAHLATARVRDGRLHESGDLRAFRENLSLTLMRGWFQPRNEDPWLIGWGDILVKVIVGQWGEGASDEEAAAKSRWLLTCTDNRNWSALIDNPDSVMAAQGRAWQLAKLMMSPYELAGQRESRRFSAWLENEVEQLKIDEPPSYAWMLGMLRQMAMNYAQKENDLGGE